MQNKLMNKAVSLLKKWLKIILWFFIVFVLLFVVVAVLIQTPVIQLKIVNYATSYVSKKTHTKVEIKNIAISFPKSVVIEGLYLEDIKRDTLIYAEQVRVNIAILNLLNSEINISSFALEDVNLNINRIKTDSLFSFNFLLTAFSDTSKQKDSVPKTKSNWTFSLDNVSLKNIKVNLNDGYGGMSIAANLKELELTMDKIDLENSIYSIDALLIESLTARVLIKSGKTNDKNTESILPKITANKIQINNTNLSYGDSVSKQSLLAIINQLQLKKTSVDLQKKMVILDNLSLSKSIINFNKYDSVLVDSTVVSSNMPIEKSDWKVSVKRIDIDDNSIAYMVINKPEIKNKFDVNHLVYRNITLNAKSFYYSSHKTAISINKFIAVDRNSFSITKLETNFCMDQHSITAKNLKVKTDNSSIDADFIIKYSSLTSLKDSLQFMIVKANMKSVSIKNSDILYFYPPLIKQSFFKNDINITTISGLINGPINNLKGKNLIIKTGVNTTLKTDFVIVGLPFIETAYYKFPKLKIASCKKDIAMMVGPLIPNTIELPEKINMQIAFKGQLKSFESTMGMSSSYGSAHLFATIDKKENFTSKVSIPNFELGNLLKKKEMFGSVSLNAEIKGHGLDEKSLNANIQADVSQIYLNKYLYHNLTIDGDITGRQFEGKINLNDENAAFNFEGLVNLNPNKEQYKFHFNLLGADLKKLNITKDEMQISLVAESDLKGKTVNEINGNVGITKIIIVHKEKNYVLDSILLTSTNNSSQSKLDISSELVDIKYKGTSFPVELPKRLNKFINNYFAFSDSAKQKEERKMQNFNFEIEIKNHPILTEVLFPELKEFEPGVIQGSFDSQKNELKLYALMNKIVYGTIEMKDFVVDINSDVNALNYKISCNKISNSQMKLDNFVLDGKLANETIIANISSIDEKQNKKLLISSQITKNKANYKLVLNPKDFYIMNNRWNVAADNYIEFGKQGFLIHHLFINKAGSQINIASVNDKFNDDLNIEINNFKLDDIFEIIKKDTSLVKGNVDGNVFLKRTNKTYGIIAKAEIKDLFFRDVSIGNLSLKAENPTKEKFNINVGLSGNDNNLTANGFYIADSINNSININAVIQSLSLKTVQAFSMEQIKEASGNITGNLMIEGKATTPDITGELTFNNVFIIPAALNNRIQLKNETLLLKKDGIYFNSFTILDSEKNTAIIDGKVLMEHFNNFIFALNVNTKNFLLFNTTAKDNKEFYGRMIIDSKIAIDGPLILPVINAKVKMKKGSSFTFAVPENKLTIDRGKDVVEFNDTLKLSPIINRNKKKEKQKSSLIGFDISSVIEIDKEATVKLLLDPSSSDSLVVKGEAALSFAIDRSGKMTLTGAYNVDEGNYIVSLESVIKRKFDIESGSTIIWNGDPLDADISINAIYSVRALPIDLIADQMTGLSETDKNEYKQHYPFLVYLKLRGKLLQPEISFEIKLPPEDKGILGGAVNTKLNMLNEDPSALNKQVFALLVLGRFIQENPLQTESNGVASSVARTTVGRLLSAQLNQLSSKVVTGVELNFDIQSYDDYQSGSAEGRTQVDIGVKKQLFNERLTVQVGGIVDVEGEKTKQNSASDITSDVTVEYKITKDGRYRFKGFRHNLYEGVIEGQLVETAVGIVYVRNFENWKEFFLSPKKQIDLLKKNK